MHKLTSTAAALLAGAAFSAAIILACDGNSPSDADAATCDCPEAEPPLAGRIVMVDDERNPGTSGYPVAVAHCESAPGAHDWILLGGGCYVNDDNDEELILYQAGPAESHALGASYACRWTNPTEITIDAVVSRAICLIPE
jgi:hypothetical protein